MNPTLDQIRTMPDIMLVQPSSVAALPETIRSYLFSVHLAGANMTAADEKHISLLTQRVGIMRNVGHPLRVSLHVTETVDQATRIALDNATGDLDLTVVPLSRTGEDLDPLCSGLFKLIGTHVDMDANSAGYLQYEATLEECQAEY